MTRSLIAAFAALSILTAAQAHADTPTKASAEAAVRSIYFEVQRGCTPTEPPRFQSITWNNFSPTPDADGHVGGSGLIHDADPGLGGPFVAVWDTGAPPEPGARKVGPWDVALEFC